MSLASVPDPIEEKKPHGMYHEELVSIDARDEFKRLKARKRAAQWLTEEEYAVVREARPKMKMGQFLELPKPPQIIEEILVAEVNLLGGPPGEGKSLLARDWAMHIAAGVPWRGHAAKKAPILWVASEGMHDADIRWGSHPLWDAAKDNIFTLPAVNLTMESEVDWLIEEYGPENLGLIVFDVIYGMGMADDNDVKNALPVINSLKRLSKELGVATLSLGHPGHKTGRRFRGSSMWRDLAYTEWHMANNLLTCEKSKIANCHSLQENYMVAFPAIDWLTKAQAGSAEDMRTLIIDLDLEENPDDSVNARAKRLAPRLDLSVDRARKVISERVKKG